MKKTIVIFLSLVVIVSCKDKAPETSKKEVQHQKEAQSNKKSTDPEQNQAEEPAQDLKILLPKEYRDLGKDNEVNELANNWLDLHQKNGKYYLEKADYTITKGYSECSGDSTKIINSKNKTIILLGNSKLVTGEVKIVPIKKIKSGQRRK